MSMEPVTRGALGMAIGLLVAAAPPLAAQSVFSAAPEPRHEERSQADPSAPQTTPPFGSAAEALAADVLSLRRFRLDPGFAAGVPVGEFGSNAGAGYGGAIDLGVGLGRTPVFVGAALDYLRHGTETRRIALFPALPDVLSDVDTTNNIFRAHALVRVQPRTGRVRPYAEGLLGFSYAYTSTGVDLGGDADTSTTHLGDYAPSVGGGGGVTILLLSGRDARLSLNLGLRYLTGSDANYLTKGAIQRDETGVAFEPSRSPLSMVSTQIGMAFEF